MAFFVVILYITVYVTEIELFLGLARQMSHLYIGTFACIVSEHTWDIEKLQLAKLVGWNSNKKKNISEQQINDQNEKKKLLIIVKIRLYVPFEKNHFENSRFFSS